MSVTCPDCGAVASYGQEIGHKTNCPRKGPFDFKTLRKLTPEEAATSKSSGRPKTREQIERILTGQPDPKATVTISLPSGYHSAEEFAKDCGFELAAPSHAAPAQEPRQLDSCPYCKALFCHVQPTVPEPGWLRCDRCDCDFAGKIATPAAPQPGAETGWDDLATCVKHGELRGRSLKVIFTEAERRKIVAALSASPSIAQTERETIERCPMSTENLEGLADAIQYAREAYLDAISRGPGGEVEKRTLQEVLMDDKGSFAPALYELVRHRRALPVSATQADGTVDTSAQDDGSAGCHVSNGEEA